MNRLVDQQKMYQTIYIIHETLKSFFKKTKAKNSVSSFSHVKICCFSLTYVTVNSISLGFGLLGQTKQNRDGYFFTIF